MISKFSKIKNAGVFNNFTWKNGGDCAGLKDFSSMNVIYGRNYSGKTTLSRLLQSFEEKALPQNMENLEFSFECTDGKVLTQDDIASNDLTVRVYNEDFVAKNLRFTQTPTSESFAVLGRENIETQIQIEDIRNELGSSESDNETGLYLKLKELKAKLTTSQNEYSRKNSRFEKSLTDKARAIKSNELYGTLTKNYNIVRIKEDITEVSTSGLLPLNEKEKERLRAISREQERAQLLTISSPIQNLAKIVGDCNSLCSRKIGTSKQIAELATNYALAKWVQEGMNLHINKDYCAFCGQPIPDRRWSELKACFNKESGDLLSEIGIKKAELTRLMSHIQSLYDNPQISSADFYSDYFSEAVVKIGTYRNTLKKLVFALKSLIDNLTQREQTITIACPFDLNDDKFNVDLESAITELNSLIMQNNIYTNALSTKIKEARKELLKDDVLEFINISDYFGQKSEIEALLSDIHSLSNQQNLLINDINLKLEAINKLEREKQDMTRGVDIINNLLLQAMPNTSLKMEAEQNLFDASIQFAIKRNGKPAYNLSEGERSLIALCYFSASLESIEVINQKLTIWIDDPISSLDDNNIFACYAVIAEIKNKLKQRKGFEQLFISTHRLNFFKYISRWEDEKTTHTYFIARKNNESRIVPLPQYIENTFFGLPLWFKTIYICASEELNLNNIDAYSSLGNDARKFFEFENAFKYPSKKPFEAMKEFWGDEIIPRIIVVKVDNEFSHSLSTPFEYDLESQSMELHDAAKRILNQLARVDEVQYNSLIEAIKLDPTI